MDQGLRLEQIVADCQKGSEQGFERLVDLYASRCYNYFYRLCGNAAISNDLLSELLIKLYEKIGSYQGGSFEKWLFTIASNLFNDHLRRQYRQRRLLEGKAKEIAKQGPIKNTKEEWSDQIQNLLKKLDDDTAELLMLRFYGQLSFKELAELRSEPIGTTLSKVHRGLKKLRDMLGGDHE
ncbi:MAG: RNA polymerase sigma factor [Sedimentisphaerales bacterium]|nr:RNA polymerase sigma factor [Sedimentisphaerales bacterium]